MTILYKDKQAWHSNIVRICESDSVAGTTHFTLKRLEATAVYHHGSLRNALISFHGYYTVTLGSTWLFSMAAKVRPFMIQVV